MSLASEHNVKIHPPSLQSWRSDGQRPALVMLMSGGVDSSVAAMMLQRAGWQLLAVTMITPDAADGGFAPLAMSRDVVDVCRALGICHHFVDIKDPFEAHVIGPFRQLYQEGRTPNPCAYCNKFIKFGLVWDVVREHFEIEHLATGHYAQVVEDNGSFRLARAADRSKDQSYFLYGIERQRLPRIHFPLGRHTKDQVREIARREALPIAERPESMDLCFAGGDYRQALDEQAESAAGPILNMSGEQIGDHQGIENFTVGQRRGIGVAAGKPIYVVRIDPSRNAVIVGTREEASRRDVQAEEVNVLIPEQMTSGAHPMGKIRSYGRAEPCTIESISEDSLRVVFDQVQFAPTPGQRLVLYNDRDQVIGGGIITEEV